MHTHASVSRIVILYALAYAWFPAAVLAQTGDRATAGSKAPLGSIGGTVVDTTGSPLPLVEVVLVDKASASARTNSSGAYRMDNVSSGFHLVRFRRVGLFPTTVPVMVQPSEITGVNAVLGMIPQALATVTVQDTLGEVLRLPPGVADRMRNGMGSYITAVDIERKHLVRTSQMLQYVAGTQVSKDGQVNSTRGAISIMTPGCMYGLPIYIDGQRIADPHAGADTLHGSDLTDYVQPAEVAVIEVYRGPSELPKTLPQDKCGGLFIWTKR